MLGIKNATNPEKTLRTARSDLEAQIPEKASHWSLVIDQVHITPEVLSHLYAGSGTQDDPFVVEYIAHDRRNPLNWDFTRRWVITVLNAIATLAVSFVSSAYSGGIHNIMHEFDASREVAILGLSLFVLGFALGPLIWGPMSEIFGRQLVFTTTFFAFTAFNAGTAGAQNIQTLMICRFFAGSFGSSPLTNAGGVIADMFPAAARGVALALFAAMPFLGPTLGPIIGGFTGETIGWRWILWICTIATGVVWFICSATVPETYSPVILRRRAENLSKITGKVYKSKMEVTKGVRKPSTILMEALFRPWVFLFTELIVLILSVYISIIYGTLYMLFDAFPIIYTEKRGWSPGIGGLPFIGVATGMIAAAAYSIWDNKRYNAVAANNKGLAPPEARLPPSIVGSIAFPVGLFWFAWTNFPSVHWIVSIIAAAPVGFGIVLVFLSILNYLIDSYVIYSASVLAANTLIRSCFGAAFPLFTTQMYNTLGIHWASSVPAFMALACAPFPYFFYLYGKPIRMKCKWAARAAEELEKIRESDDDYSGGEPMHSEILKEGKRGDLEVVGGSGWENFPTLQDTTDTSAEDPKGV